MRFVLHIWLALLTIDGIGQSRYSVVIHEIMVDPSPVVGLPNYEWVELRNLSASPIDLGGWRLGTGSSQSSPFPSFELAPGEFLLLCSNAALSSISALGNALSIGGFPSLDNDGGLLYLQSSTGRAIHALQYNSDWYHNELKRSGGWSLEMMDSNVPCMASSNWSASLDPSGGTAGRVNSVTQAMMDDTPPAIRNASAIDSLHLLLEFDEPLDSASAVDRNHYALDTGPAIMEVELQSPLFDKVVVTLDQPILNGSVHLLTVTAIGDCSGNLITEKNQFRIGLPTPAGPGDIVINEILFNPATGESDWIELFNPGKNILDASKLSIANRNSSGLPASIVAASPSSRYIFPGDYCVLCIDADQLRSRYPLSEMDRLLVIGSMPSYPDDEGSCLILDGQGNVLDELHYFDDWHFKLLSNAEGVSLERIDALGPSNDPQNWHSASSTEGYGTPTRKNSQSYQPGIQAGIIETSPRTVSPDNDGRDDFATISYRLDSPGFMGNINIFDAAGRVVKRLVRNRLLGNNGYWHWDGLDDQGRRLPIGVYIISTELFNLEGRKEKFVNTVVLAGKLN